MSTTTNGVERVFRGDCLFGSRFEVRFPPGVTSACPVYVESNNKRLIGQHLNVTWKLSDIQNRASGYTETFDHLPTAPKEEEPLPSTAVEAAPRRFRLRDDGPMLESEWTVHSNGEVFVESCFTGHKQISRYSLKDLLDTDRFVEIVEPVKEKEGVVALSTGGCIYGSKEDLAAIEAASHGKPFVIDTNTLPPVAEASTCVVADDVVSELPVDIDDVTLVSDGFDEVDTAVVEVTDRTELNRAVTHLALLAEVRLYRKFREEAVAAHALASPNRVEIEFARAEDRLRAGLKGLGAGERREEESFFPQPKMEADPT